MKVKTDNIVSFTAAMPDKPALYIIHGKDGDLLIDTAYRIVRKSVERFIEQYNVKWIFLTHAHYDHANNAAYLQRKYGCKVIVHEKDNFMLLAGKQRQLYPSARKYTMAVKIVNLMSAIFFKVIHCKPDYILTDDDTDFLKKLGFDAEIVMLPGHTVGSMGIFHKGVFYVGDACSSVHGKYKTVYLGEDIKQLKKSEKVIFDYKPKYICAGHGRIIFKEIGGKTL